MNRINRRSLLQKSLYSGVAALAIPQFLSAQTRESCESNKTPAQAEGPFYPVVDQVDTDADLIQLSGASTIAKGQIVIVEGMVTDQHCAPVAGALVEIWQACDSGRYNHPVDSNPAPLDPNFQYWGKAITQKNGSYRFRTIIPGAYPAGSGWIRPPHIHFKIAKLGYVELITQMYFADQSLNAKDRILMRLPPADRKKVIVHFQEQQNVPHPVGRFDISIEKV